MRKAPHVAEVLIVGETQAQMPADPALGRRHRIDHAVTMKRIALVAMAAPVLPLVVSRAGTATTAVAADHRAATLEPRVSKTVSDRGVTTPTVLGQADPDPMGQVLERVAATGCHRDA